MEQSAGHSRQVPARRLLRSRRSRGESPPPPAPATAGARLLHRGSASAPLRRRACAVIRTTSPPVAYVDTSSRLPQPGVVVAPGAAEPARGGLTRGARAPAATWLARRAVDWMARPAPPCLGATPRELTSGRASKEGKGVNQSEPVSYLGRRPRFCQYPQRARRQSSATSTSNPRKPCPRSSAF